MRALPPRSSRRTLRPVLWRALVALVLALATMAGLAAPGALAATLPTAPAAPAPGAALELAAGASGAALELAAGASGAALELAAGSSDAELELAGMYAPVVVVRAQPALCAAGEPYRPVAVEAVFGNPDVVLRGPDGRVVKAAPTAADLAGLTAGYYLDYPGNPLAPRCGYERWAAGLQDEPTVYARVVAEPGAPDVLTLQYWFFWVFNDWNDKHEGDWEMIQLRFPAATAAEALEVEPTEVAYAQHEGSEVSDWDDPKLHRDGNHVAVYPGQGSHAAYFTQSLWFGKSAAAGFGCDNTATPGTEVRPQVVLMPADPAADPQFAWLTFEGRWGERAPSFNNGPTGPNTKDQWAEPVTWQDTEGRPSAVAIPAVGGAALDAFCSLTAGGSRLFVDLLNRPWVVVLLICAVVAAVVLLVRATRWRGSTPVPLAQERRAGQIVVSSFGVWRRFARPLLVYGLGGLALFALGAGLREVVLAPLSGAGDLAAVGTPTDPWRQVVSVLLTVALQVLPAFVIIAAAQHLMADAAPDGKAGALAGLAATFTRPAALLVLVLTYLAVLVLSLSLIGLPVAAWLLARWAVASPVAAFEGVGVRTALGRSAVLTSGHRWRTLALTLLLLFLGGTVPGIVGAVVLLVTPASFLTANVISGLVLAVLATAAAVGLALQYLDLRARQGD